MPPRPKIYVTRGIWHGHPAYLLRWHDPPVGKAYPGHQMSYWFVDEGEAITVRDAMRAGETFEQAFRRVWNAA